MIIVYESKTGFTKRYAHILSAKTGCHVFCVKDLANIDRNEEIIFLGWMKVGIIQGLKKLQSHNVKAVCGSGTGRSAEPDVKTVMERNHIKDIPFFYLRGGCLPLKEIRGMDKIMLSMFVRMLKSRQHDDEEIKEAIDIIENGFDGVNEENLAPVLTWLNARQGDTL